MAQSTYVNEKKKSPQNVPVAHSCKSWTKDKYRATKISHVWQSADSSSSVMHELSSGRIVLGLKKNRESASSQMSGNIKLKNE
jgi:hypothetical protein